MTAFTRFIVSRTYVVIPPTLSRTDFTWLAESYVVVVRFALPSMKATAFPDPSYTVVVRVPSGLMVPLGCPFPLCRVVNRFPRGSMTALRLPLVSHTRVVRLPCWSVRACTRLLESNEYENRFP